MDLVHRNMARGAEQDKPLDCANGSNTSETSKISNSSVPALYKTTKLYNLCIMNMKPAQPVEANLDAIFSALADPTRRSILTRLATGTATVNELAAPFQMSQPAVSKHLKVLEQAGLVERAIDKQRRPAKLCAEPMMAAVEWLEEFKQFWSGSFDQLDNLLDELKSAEKRNQNNG